MKKLISLFMGLMILILNACQKDIPEPIEETGILVVDIGLSIKEYEVKKGLKAFVPVSDFKVTVYQADGTEAVVFETASSMPDSIVLKPGDYYVEAHSNNDLPAEFDNPYYYGVSDVFTISSNMRETVTVTCGLANTMVSVVWSEALTGTFTDYSATVSSILESLEFTKNETRAGYFQPLPLEILVKLWYQNPEGSESLKILSGSIPDPQAGRHYKIFINTTISSGSGSFLILLDEAEIPLEVVELIYAPEEVQDNSIKYGDILISEIMFDPTALSDAEGEWIEIYNNSGRSINLQNLVLERDGTNRHKISSSIELLPGQYHVLARTANATDAPNTYVYGTAITLPNTSGVIYIYDETNGTELRELIFSVNYGTTNFPRPAGASISLNPERFNAADAVLGTSWCISTSAYNTGDLGTPGKVNDGCQ